MDPNEIDGSEDDIETDFAPTFPENILKLKHSFGYDCKRFYNLVLIDDDTLVFASGTYLHYFTISTKEMHFRESVFASGIGFVTKNYHSDYRGLLTIGENGSTPTVFIYEYPSNKIRALLKGAAKQQFTCGSYNYTGELFASQAGYPDYMLTIWRWEKQEIILRSKAFQNDVLHVHFSRYNPNLLVSCGLSHIKFWKMANTFTGLKLQGDLGRFGKTDFSDIYAIFMLADENVISGCEWGNMLLWEAGLIKFEICRKGRKPCHTKPIVDITMKNGEVTTVGMDGYVRIWFWETVDTADPPDDDRFVEIEPIFEFYVGKCEIRMIQKIKPFDAGDFGYYVLDGSGGIWYCDLNTSDIPKASYKLYSCHGGKVVAAQTSPVSPHLMTLGADGRSLVYNYETEKLILEKQFPSVGTDLLWFSGSLSKSSMELVASFEDGVIRQIYLDLRKPAMPNIHLIRPIKAHTAAVTRMTVNPASTVLITGSDDHTIFMHSLDGKQDNNNFLALLPLGYIEFKGIPYCFCWKTVDEQTLLIGCKTGEVYEYCLPTDVTEEHTFLSYNLSDCKQMKSTKFVSVKSMIRRELKRTATMRRKAKKKQNKLEKIEKLKAVNPGLQIDMEAALADSEPDEEEEPLHIPSIANPILWLRYVNDYQNVWVSMGGYDAGYIYVLDFDAKEPILATMIKDGDDCEVHSFLDMNDYLIFGLNSGKLRVNFKNPSGDFTDLRNYRLFNMHDPLNGNISRMLLSHDTQYLCTIGHDGNVFVYHWNGPKNALDRDRNILFIPQRVDSVEDILDPNHPSLEQEKIYAEINRQQEAAAAHDQKVLESIAVLQLKFNDLWELNLKLPEDLRIRHKDVPMDKRIIRQIKTELQAELDDVRDDCAYDLEVAQVGKQKLYEYFLKNLDHIPIKISSIRGDGVLHTFRVEKLDENFEAIKDDIEQRLLLEALKRRPLETEDSQLAIQEPPLALLAEEHDESIPEPPPETFFFGRDPNKIIPRFTSKMLRLLRRYRGRQIYEVERTFVWEKMLKAKPDPNKNHPDDDAKISEAERSIGDYKLKTGSEYEPQPHETLTWKYREVIELRERLHKAITSFNEKVFKMRENKKQLYTYIEQKRKRLKDIHFYLPEKMRLHLEEIPSQNLDAEYPELNLNENYTAGCDIEISDILYLENTLAELLPKQPPPALKASISPDELHELERYFALNVQKVQQFPNAAELLDQLAKMPQQSDSSYYTSSEEGEDSPWLTEIRYRWLIHLFVEQQGIIHCVNDAISLFNDQLKKLIKTRLQVKFETEYMSSYMVAMNQELYILRDSEEIENQLLSNAEQAMESRNQAQALINSLNRQMDDLRKQCERLKEQINATIAKFMSSMKGHKFFDFMRRIFKKKWRPPKPPKVGDESSESSDEDESSSEEDEDTKSIDSTDMTAIRLDESHCPAGLDRVFYNMSFAMRSERHSYEKGLAEAQKEIECRKKDVRDAQKLMKEHEEIYHKENATLLEFRRKRQQELNKVHVSVILHMHQLQHFREGEDYRDITKSVLFDATCLNELQGRVEKLKVETLETRRLHRINIVHLRRMNADIKFMRSEIHRLEEDIKQEMMKKFGLIINLDELEEEVLRKYVFELETTAEEELNMLEVELRKKKKELILLQEQLIKDTKINSEKLNILSLLTEEKNYLNMVLECQEKNYQKWAKPSSSLNLDRDIEKLLAVDREQKEQIKCLEREICTLRMKAKPLQIDQMPSDQGAPHIEVMPNDNIPSCPEIFQGQSFNISLLPDDFIMDRCQKVVQKLFMQHFAKMTTRENIRRYATKVTRFLAQAAYSFEGSVTDDIMDCIIENMQTLVPKKYFMLLSRDELQKLFKEIVCVFDYERSDVNTEDVVSVIYYNAREALRTTEGICNKTQYMLVHMFKELIEILPLEEFQSDDTVQFIVNNMEKESYFDGQCINIEGLVENVLKYAQANLLDTITAIPIRQLAQRVQKEYVKRRPLSSITLSCSVSEKKNKSKK